MLTRTQKQKIIDELADRFKRQKIALFTNFHKIPVSKLQTLRRLLKKESAEYKVAKKTLLDRALKSTGFDLKTKDLQGEIGVTFGYGDDVSPAKILFKFSKENETFQILGGMLGKRFLNSGEIIALAKMPSREVLLAQVTKATQAPLQRLVNVLQGNIRNLVVVLNKIKELR